MIRKTEIYQVFFFIQQYIKSECNDNGMHDLLHKNSILEISVLLGGILQFRIITSLYVFTPPPTPQKKKTPTKAKIQSFTILVTFTIYIRKCPVR